MDQQYCSITEETIVVSEDIFICIIRSPLSEHFGYKAIWGPWRLEQAKDANGISSSKKDGTPRMTKVAYQLNGIHKASSTREEEWTTYPEAVKAVNTPEKKFDGICIRFSEDKMMLGIDLDHVIVDGKLSPERDEVVTKAHTFTEISPSKEGLHMYLPLSGPLELERNRHTNPDGTGYEFYTDVRYFTVTEDPWTESYPLRTVTPDEALEVLKMMGYPWKEEIVQNATPSPIQIPSVTSFTNEELLTKAFAAANGAKIKALYDGGISGYPSGSEADLAFCSLLVFYTRDEAQLDRIWLASPMGSRSKTQARAKYRADTIRKAISGHTGAVYTGPQVSASATSQPAQFKPFISAMKLLTMEIQPIEWHVDKLLVRGTLNMLSALPAQMKSYITLHLAMCVAQGLPLFGQFPTIKTPVLFVEEEDNQSVLLDHLHHLSDDDDQLDDLFIVNDTGEKIGDEFVDWIIREAKKKGAGLVILDTLRSLHTAKENDSDSMQPIMDALRHITRENITTLFLHHNKKGQQGDKEANTMDLARGSGAVVGSVHGHITLSKKKDAEGLFLVLEQAKNKSVMELDPFTVRVKELTDPGEVIPSRLRFEYAGDHDAGKTARDALVVRLKRHFSEHKGEYFTRKNFVELKFAKGAADQTLRTALEHLIKKEQIISKKYADLFTSQKTAVQEKHPRANTAVYCFNEDAPVETEIGNDEGVEVYTDDSGIIF